jgi:pimeloyl-ACP methyl ester carboxylesterase
MRAKLSVLALVCASTLIACGAPAKAPKVEPDDVLEVETLGTDTSDLAEPAASEESRLPEVEKAAVADAERIIQGLEARLETEDDRLALRNEISEQALATGRTIEKKEPDRALGLALCASFHARQILVEALEKSDPRMPMSDPELLRGAALYNASLSDVLALIEESESGDGGNVEAQGPVRLYRVSWDLPPDWIWTPDHFEFLPAARLDIRGLTHHHRTHGVGAPVVAVRRGIDRLPEAGGEVFPGYERFYTLTALIDLQGEDDAVEASLRLVDPFVESTLEMAGVQVPLATDMTATLAFSLGETDATGIGEKGMFRPGQYLEQTGLYMMEPFREDKIPVVFVHGLGATAWTFLEMVNDLRGDPEIRERYQFWFFQYPSGLSFAISALVCRRTLNQAQSLFNPEGDLPDMDRIVLVGHSMGGLISRFLVTRDRSKIWGAHFTKPLAELTLDPEDADLLREAYFSGSVPYVDRVMFLATPHKGSPFADNIIGKAGAGISGTPDVIKELTRRILDTNEDALTPEVAARRRGEKGIRTTSPKSLLIKSLSESEIDPGVIYHTILGDRGKDEPLEESSDSIVPYWSSHLDGAASELVVPSNHIVHDDPAAIEEVRRILLLHLESEGV